MWPLCPLGRRSADFSERPLPFNGGLGAKFLGMTTNNDRFPFLSRHLTERLR